MEEQRFIIKEISCFEPKHIFECGQCFRWNIEEDGSYTGIVGKIIINVKKQQNDIIFTGIGKENLEETCTRYFDLNRDYQSIKDKLSKADENLKIGIQYGEGIRILNQDLWECLISFIISANNNIPRIKKIIEAISKEYGEEIIWNNKSYYTFPTVEQLSKASIEDLRRLGLGFRDKRVFLTTKKIYSKEIELEKLHYIKNSEEVKQKLLTLDGVGDKVADCVLLFSTLKRTEVFPVDVWVRRVMNELYLNKEEKKVKNEEIQKLATKKYADLAGIAQQYLFYWKREQGRIA